MATRTKGLLPIFKLTVFLVYTMELTLTHSTVGLILLSAMALRISKCYFSTI